MLLRRFTLGSKLFLARHAVLPTPSTPPNLCLLSYTTSTTTSTSSSSHDGSGTAGITLQHALRMLYRKVHPDLFTAYPAEKLENERSFKLLQDYLQQAREGDPLHPTARTPYHFTFYLYAEEPPSQQAAGGEGDMSEGGEATVGAAAAAADALDCVQVTLAPPSPPPGAGAGASSSVTGLPLAPGAQKGLALLLSRCGVAVDWQQRQDALTGQHLLAFLPAAAEVVRQHEAGSVSSEVRVANLRGAMRLARQVIVGIAAPAARDLSGPQQVELLERLAGVLGELPEDVDLSGQHILLGRRTALDPAGYLLLDVGVDPEEWGWFLEGVDLQYAASRRALVAAVKGLEISCAAALGLSQVFTTAAAVTDHTYRECLERLLAHAATHGPVPYQTPQPSSSSSRSRSSADGPRLPLYICPYMAASAQGAAGSPEQRVSGYGFEVHPDLGYIQAPVSADPSQVYSFVQECAPAAVVTLQRRQQQEAALQELTATTRTRLRLRRLARDPLVSPEQYRAACLRLQSSSAELLQHMEGCSIRVGLVNRVAPAGVWVDIAWDWEL